MRNTIMGLKGILRNVQTLFILIKTTNMIYIRSIIVVAADILMV